MEKSLTISVAITIVFFIVKMIEMRLSNDESKPLKNVVRDTFIVFFSAFLPLLFFNGTLLGVTDDIIQTQIFTGEPEF